MAALQLAVVAGYYTDANVRAAIGYPGQLAKPVTAFDYPAYIGVRNRVEIAIWALGSPRNDR